MTWIIFGVEIYDANVLTNTAQKKVEAINNFSADIGCNRIAYNRLVFDLSAKYSTTTATEHVMINGKAADKGQIASLSPTLML